jgi:hypothetical protein
MVPGRTLFVIALLAAAGCDGRTPTQPTPSTQPGPRPPSPVASFEFTGMVTGEGGAPMPGAVVTVAHYEGREAVHWPTVSTDASGHYSIRITASTLSNGWVARLQVAANGYEEYWRDLKVGAGPQFLENFRLYRLARIAAGDSTALTVPPDLGSCRSEIAAVCAVVRITIPKPGRLTIEAVSDDTMTERPPLGICCESGNEVSGNPLTLSVAPGPELELSIGLGQGVSTTRSFKVKTSFEAF